MNTILQQDLYRYIGNGNKKFANRLHYILIQFIYCFRHVSLSRNPFSRLFWGILHRRCMFHADIQIPVGTNIGPGFRISHFGGVVVNPDAKIGKNFSIAQGALIGNAAGKKAGVPTIGDNVMMSANSVVIGGATIGDYAMIAPGAFVNFDVLSNSIVIGNPGKIIPTEKPTDKYNVYRI